MEDDEELWGCLVKSGGVRRVVCIPFREPPCAFVGRFETPILSLGLFIGNLLLYSSIAWAGRLGYSSRASECCRNLSPLPLRILKSTQGNTRCSVGEIEIPRGIFQRYGSKREQLG
jgi:hypothetical protein